MAEDEGKSLGASRPKKASALLWSCMVAGVVIFFMAAVAGPKLIGSKLYGNEAAAIGALKTIQTSQGLYREQGHADYAGLQDLEGANLVDTILGGGTKQGYVFECRASIAHPNSAWWASASPEEPGESGSRYFAVNHEGVIHYSPEPIKIDPATCLIPSGTTPVGR